MLEFPDFKQKYPNLYLAAHELQKIKEILVNENGQVVGYIEKKGDKYGYRTPDKQWDEGLEYDDFIGPDPQGNIITVINGKKFFINDDFPYPKMEFDQIDGPDSQGNYVAHQKKKQYFIRKDGTLLTLNLSDSDTQESWDRIEKIDKNQNYILDQGESSYLVNAEGNFISNAYLDISTIDDCGYYQAITPEGGVILLDKTGKEILSQAYGKIRLLSGGEYELSLNGKIGLYTIEKDALQLECIYDEIIPLTGEVYQVRKDGTC
ncbi:MAG: hypothetical protein LBD11_04115 [Candidatus Peribacteria bacterium]|jgi:hypothetical protein|nr:hypothetical protein [Candidatus Peribacteria bacterium]